MAKMQEIQSFDGRQIRTVRDEEGEKLYFSVVDVIETLTETDRPRKYWSDLKVKLKKNGCELSDSLGQLRLQSSDGKYYKTDVADHDQLSVLIAYIPSAKTEEFRQWMEQSVASEHDAESLPVMQQYVQNKVISMRGCDVISDADIAELYGVDTKRVNEAVKNNPDKFPEDYMFAVTEEEMLNLRSKISTTKVSARNRATTKVFTEKGLYMLATVLKSKRATDVTFAIIETFAKVRYLKKEIVDLHKEADPKRQAAKMKRFGDVISDIVMPELETSETESTLELNFFIGKIKHSVKRVRKNK